MYMSAYSYICTERLTHNTCILSSRYEQIYIYFFCVHTSKMKGKLSLHSNVDFLVLCHNRNTGNFIRSKVTDKGNRNMMKK